MEGARKKIVLGVGIGVLVMLGVLLVILIIKDSKKPEDAKTDEDSVDIPKFQLVEITGTRNNRNRDQEVVSYEYDEFGRYSKVTYKIVQPGADQEQYLLECDFSYGYEDGEPYSKMSYVDSYGIKNTRTYDASGTLRKEEMFLSGKNWDDVIAQTTIYDEKGREIQDINYEYDGSISSIEERAYDAYGNTVQWLRKDYDDGEETVTVRFRGECDEKGRVVRLYVPEYETPVREIEYFDDGSRVDRSNSDDYYYDSEGRETKHVMYSDDRITRTIEREYQNTEYGYLETEIVTEYPEGTTRRTDTEYDSEGREIYRKEYDRGNELYVVRDDAGRIIRKEEKFAEGGVLIRETYGYDEDGNLISQERSDRTLTYRYVPVSLTAEQAKERAKFCDGEKMLPWND